MREELDKNYIQNAFKSLDEIEAELKAKRVNKLTEAVLKDSPLNVNVDLNNFGGKNNDVDVLSKGNSEKDKINTEALVKNSPVNINVDAHDFGGKNNDVDVLSGNLANNLTDKKPLDEKLDTDELWDKYVGQGCSIDYLNTKENLTPAEQKLQDEHASIAALVDAGNDFTDSLWEVALDIGKVINIKGDNLKLDLTEKLPKDLAKGYSNIRTYGKPAQIFNDATLDDIWTGNRRRNSKVDYEKADYREISKDTALSIPKNERYRLRFLIYDKSPYSTFNIKNLKPNVVMYNKEGKPITGAELHTYNKHYETPSGNSYRNTRYMPYEHIVKIADKIYWTDEEAKKLYQNPATINPDYVEAEYSYRDDSDYKHFVPDDINIHGRTVYDTDNNTNPISTRRAKAFNDRTLDTGAHFKYDKDRYDRDFYHEPTKTITKEKKWYSRRSTFPHTPGRYVEINRRMKVPYYSLINLQDKLERLKNNIDRRLSSYESETEYSKISKRISAYQQQIADLEEQIKLLQDQLALAPSKEEQENELLDEIDKITKEYFDTKEKVKELIGKDKKAVKEEYLKKEAGDPDINTAAFNNATSFNTGVAEDLNTEENSDNQAKTVYNIYSVNPDTKEENFDNDYYSSDEDCIDIAKELSSQKPDLDVVASKVIIHPDKEDNTIEVLWSTRNEILTEGKKFNLKDDKDIGEAMVYKHLNSDKDTLVAVDPSAESKKDIDTQSHAGDALLKCRACNTLFTYPVDKLVRDGNTDIYNRDMRCEHCGALDGYTYDFQLATPESEDAKEAQTDEDVKDISDEIDNKVDEIINNDKTDLPEVESDIDLSDVNEVVEESFDKLINPYLNKLYENISSYKTTNISQISRNTLKIEGLITGNNSKEIVTEFLLKVKNSESNNLLFEGYNPLLSDNKAAFTLKSNVEKNKLLFETFEYAYNKEVDNKEYLIEGIESNK